MSLLTGWAGAARRFAGSRAAGYAASQGSLLISSALLTFVTGYLGGSTLVGSIAPILVTLQLVTGVLQQSVGDVGLLVRTAPREVDGVRGFVFGVALYAGSICTVISLTMSVAVTRSLDFAPILIAFSTIPIIALEMFRYLAMAGGRSAVVTAESLAWIIGLAAGALLCIASKVSMDSFGVFWLIWNTVFAASVGYRRRLLPDFRGGLRWLQNDWKHFRVAAVDSLWSTGGTFVAQQAVGIVYGASVLGHIRITYQIFAPIALLALILRRMGMQDAGQRNGVRRTRTFVIALAMSGVLAGSVATLADFVAALSFLGVGWATLVAAVERSAYAMQLIEAGRLLARSALSEALLIRRLASVFFVTFGVFGASIAGTAGYFAGIGAVEMLSVYFYARVRSPARHTGTPG